MHEAVIKRIERQVEDATGMTIEQIMRPTHAWKEATAKRVLYYMLDGAGMRYPDIAKYYGVKRANVWASIRKAKETYMFDRELTILIQRAKQYEI